MRGRPEGGRAKEAICLRTQGPLTDRFFIQNICYRLAGLCSLFVTGGPGNSIARGPLNPLGGTVIVKGAYFSDMHHSEHSRLYTVTVALPFVFGRSWFHISDRRPVALIDEYRGFVSSTTTSQFNIH
jgi:hypothetical protein